MKALDIMLHIFTDHISSYVVFFQLHAILPLCCYTGNIFISCYFSVVLFDMCRRALCPKIEDATCTMITAMMQSSSTGLLLPLTIGVVLQLNSVAFSVTVVAYIFDKKLNT
ncbi:uncharacterized protein A4U43_C08F13600 [Asparagus officinalis]|nr:uncharacterized protein A4U43_C08F13600 [Asparagus officinalis]